MADGGVCLGDGGVLSENGAVKLEEYTAGREYRTVILRNGAAICNDGLETFFLYIDMQTII
jgi:hypothetical protein